MCTISIIRLDEIIRIACNRDEQRTRLPAVPPALLTINGTRTMMPTDANAGGTWIGVNEFGVAMTLLNMNGARELASDQTISRGGIIPSLIHSESARAACELLHTLTLSHYRPFRLILIDAERTMECRCDHQSIRTHEHDRPTPLMFTSSGLGDDKVDPPRRELFDQMMISPGPASQDAFHRHSWAGKPHLSVCMRRADAMTVSCTTLTLSSSVSSMHYHAGPPDLPAHTTIASLMSKLPSAA